MLRLPRRDSADTCKPAQQPEVVRQVWQLLIKETVHPVIRDMANAALGN